jgi:hypothetical protein
MATTQRLKFPIRGGESSRGAVIISGMFTVGGAGGVASADGASAGLSGAKNSTVKTVGKTGRYSVALDRNYRKLRFMGAPALVGPADAAIATADIAYYRNRTTSGFDIQCCLGGADADANPTTGTEIHWSVHVTEL